MTHSIVMQRPAAATHRMLRQCRTTKNLDVFTNQKWDRFRRAALQASRDQGLMWCVDR